AAGGDILGGRPTVLWALALEGLSLEERDELLSLAGEQENQHAPNTAQRLARVRELYLAAGVFEKASRLIEKHRERAEKIADDLEPEELRALLYYLIDSVLDHGRENPALVLTTIR